MQFFSFSIEKPQFLLLILLIFPAILYVLLRLKRITHSISSTETNTSTALVKSLKFSVLTRTFFRCLAWIFVVLAFSEISFSSKKVPVHKSGNNVFFVFDISYSMLAKDVATPYQTGKRRITRLEAVKLYSNSLLERLSSSSFSAVLAKGDGFVAIPETEDSAIMHNMIEELSPTLMTSSGSSLGKGIEAAINAISLHSSKSQYIWVFTDGDETDSKLEKALETAAKFRIPVTLVGFGSENETEITAGDGKTIVKTALRAKKMQELASNANKHYYQKISGSQAMVTYVDSHEVGSAWKLLNQIQKSNNDEELFTYEVQKVNQHALFICLTLLCLILSFVFSEFRLSSLKKFKNLLSTTLIFASVFTFSSCLSEKKQILDGVWAWYEGKYNSATASFLNTASKTPKDSLANQYAIFDLSATYLSMNEIDFSIQRLSQLNLDDETLPQDFRSSGFYNMALAYEQKGEYQIAAKYFKKAILANPSNTKAKINLELCEREIVEKQAKSSKAEMQGVNEEKPDNSNLSSELFNLIRQNESKKWRNMSDNTQQEDGAIDY